MRSPTIPDSFYGNHSKYAMVIAVATRAREIASKAELEGDILLEKPVNLAIDEFAQHQFIVHESDRED